MNPNEYLMFVLVMGGCIGFFVGIFATMIFALTVGRNKTNDKE